VTGAGWVAVPLAAGDAEQAPVGIIVGARRLVAWRGDDGAWRVWDDRCPHRGAALSAGRVRGGELVCAKHGWRFDASGRRIAPADAARAVSDLTACARVYETRTDDTGVWVRLDAEFQQGETTCR
jgi:phenylpropionate dioxygenase-like ring-hydroxylating dioxygenase large terminal subunit